MSRLAAIALIGALPSPAFAYFCTSADNKPTSPSQVWMSRCIPFYISTSGTNFDSDERIRLVQQSFAVWSSEACTDLEFQYRGKTTETEAFDVANPADNLNVIASIEDDASAFPNRLLLALTLTRFSVATGEILDADIILNGVGFRFDEVSDKVSCEAGARTFDLRNTLVHEMGHFIGFDHTTLMEATMFPSAQACEVDKRDLAEDDRMGVCNVYPKGMETKTCTPPPSYTPNNALDPTPFRNQCDRPLLPVEEPGGCSCGAARGETGLWLALVALAGIRLTGRRTSGPLRRS